MTRASHPAILSAALWLWGCARAVPDDAGDVRISGTTDLGEPLDIVGVNWDEYPDKNHLVDAAAPEPDVPPPPDIVVVTDQPVTTPGCGVPGAVCCTSARCGRGAECRGGVCAETPTCGAAGQPCCGVAACGPGNMCSSGRCELMVTCGGSGGPCCSSTSPCLSSLLCVSGACVPCGGPGQACCAGSTGCFRGYSCGGGLCRAAM